MISVYKAEGQYPSALYTLIIQSAGRIITRRVVVQH
jgi:hypothetical protein